MMNAIGGEASTGHGPPSGDAARSSAPPTVLLTIGEVVRSSVSFLSDLIDRIVNGIRRIAPLVLGLGCQSTNEGPAAAPPIAETTPIPADAATVETGPRQLGKFTITFYYVVRENELAAARASAANDNETNQGTGSNEGTRRSEDTGSHDGTGSNEGSDGDAELASVAPDLVTLYDGSNRCEPIADVSREFASQLALQGTGELHDGRIVNIWGTCNCKRTPCFMITKAQWGTAGTGKPLQPFRTVAVDPKLVKLGSLLYIPLLEGRTMPGRRPWGGYVHDGCVVADDTGGHILGKRIDLFVGRKAYFLGMSGSGGRHAWARNVPVFDGNSICERKGRRVGRKSASI
jgi:3D (Asp-Asp-Asp) domain-containing protein